MIFSDQWSTWVAQKTSLKITFLRNKNLKLVLYISLYIYVECFESLHFDYEEF